MKLQVSQECYSRCSRGMFETVRGKRYKRCDKRLYKGNYMCRATIEVDVYSHGRSNVSNRWLPYISRVTGKQLFEARHVM